MLKEVETKLSLGQLQLELIEEFNIKGFSYDTKENEKPVYIYIETQDSTKVKLCLDFYNEEEVSILICHIKSVGEVEEYKELLLELSDIIVLIEEDLEQKGFVII